MDPERFDSLVQTLSAAASRRRALAALLAGLVAPLVPDRAEADRKQGKGRGKGKGKSEGGGNGRGRDQKRGKDVGAEKARGKGEGRKKRAAKRPPTDGAGGACREEGHPCEGNQRCCEDLVCIVSGPGEAERCTPCGNAGDPCCDDDVCAEGFICDDDGTCVGCGSGGQPCCDGETCDDESVCDTSTGLCTACGGETQPCCAGESCSGGLVCDDDGSCAPCGGGQQLCCAGGECDTGFTCDEGGSCVACGDDGQACCDDGAACGAGLICSQGNQCVACGGADQPCCVGETCDGGYVCDADAGECVACGGDGQACCDTGDACGEGLSCTPDGVCSGCGGEGGACCADDACDAGLVCDEDGTCASCGTNAVVCGTGGDAQCVPGVCCEEDEGEGPGCAEGETCIAGGCINEGQVRIVLRWGAEPRDLDSHLWLPPESPYHIAWFDQGTLAAFPFAELDIDDVSGFGPETITISDLQAGTYLYAVHLYAGLGTIGTSGATVQVFQGATLLATYTPPAEGPWDPQDPSANPYNDGLIWWKVFELTSDGTNAVVTGINASSTDPAPYGTSGPPLAVFRSGAGFPMKPTVAGGAAKRRRGRKGETRGRARRS